MLPRKYLIIALMLFALTLAGCAAANANASQPAAQVNPAAATTPAPVSATEVPKSTDTPAPTLTPTITPTPTITLTPSITPTPTEDLRPLPESLGAWNPVPTVSARAVEIYKLGLQMGNDPHAYSVIGDCQSMPNVFLGIYDQPGRYNLANYDYMQTTIDQFKGSFERKSAAVKDGMSVAAVLNPQWADPEQCEANETPVDCELRVHKPVIMFINLGTNWKNGGPTAYEKYLRQIVEIVVKHGTVPVLTTKADNIEGNNSLNIATARVAYDYDVPLFNFWLASDFLPNHGLDSGRDNVYLTPRAWDLRNFYALQTLDTLWNAFKTVTP